MSTPAQPPVEQLHAALAILSTTYASIEMVMGGDPPAEMKTFADVDCHTLTPSTCAFIAADALEMAIDSSSPFFRQILQRQVENLRSLACSLLADEQRGGGDR